MQTDERFVDVAAPDEEPGTAAARRTAPITPKVVN